MTDIAAIKAKLDVAGKLVTRDRWHRYKVGGELYPGVTSVIGCLDKPALVHWSARIQQEADIETAWLMADAARDNGEHWFNRDAYVSKFLSLSGREKEHQKKLREAGDLGTDLHALIEQYLLKQMGQSAPAPTITHEEAYFIYSGFEKWAADVQLTPICVETYVYSLTHRYAGALDCLALVEGRLSLLDWKTGRIYGEQRLQNIAYRKAFEELTGERAEGLLVRLPKEGGETSIEPHPVTDDVEVLFRVFLSLVPVFHWVKAEEKARRG